MAADVSPRKASADDANAAGWRGSASRRDPVDQGIEIDNALVGDVGARGEGAEIVAARRKIIVDRDSIGCGRIDLLAIEAHVDDAAPRRLRQIDDVSEAGRGSERGGF